MDNRNELYKGFIVPLSGFLTDEVENSKKLKSLELMSIDSDQDACPSYTCAGTDICADSCDDCRDCNDCRDCSDCTDCSDCNDTPSEPVSLSLYGGYEEFTWTISNLGGPFTTKEYIRAGLTIYPFTIGGVASLGGIKAYKNATAVGDKTVSDTVEYEPGSYTFWAFAQIQDGTYWPAGSASVTVQKKPYEQFDWTYAGRDPTTNARIVGTTKQRGLVACITADEWNALVDAVNQRKGTSISHVSRGMVANSVAVVRPVANALGVSIPSGFSAALFNQLRMAVNQL